MWRLWASDGTPQGNPVIEQFANGYEDPEFATAGRKLFFIARSPSRSEAGALPGSARRAIGPAQRRRRPNLTPIARRPHRRQRATARRVRSIDVLPANAQFQGDQIRGFGFTHDGSTATIFDFMRSRFFTLTDDQRQDLEQFVLAFDTNFAPIVGQQITLTSDNAAVAGPRIDLLIARAETSFVLVNQPHVHECDLIAKGVAGGLERGSDHYPDSCREPDFHSERRTAGDIDGHTNPLAGRCRLQRHAGRR